MKNSLVLIVVTISFLCCALSAKAQSPGGATLVDEKGRPVQDGTVLVKGKSIVLAAKVAPSDGGVPARITWSSAPAGAVDLKDDGNGRVRATALRDWFDEMPRREPTARVIACVNTVCVSALITCLPEVTGRWPTRLLEGFFGATEDRNLVFVQDGRTITFDQEPFNLPDPGRIATLRLEGASLRMVNSGNVITRFDGTLTSRSAGNGNWATYKTQ